MFGIDFSEFMVIGIVALVVLGPERLPKVARTLGHLYGRVQRYASEVRESVNREMELGELKKMRDEFRGQVAVLETKVNTEIQEAEQRLHLIKSDVEAEIEADAQRLRAAPSEPLAQTPAPQLELELDGHTTDRLPPSAKI